MKTKFLLLPVAMLLAQLSIAQNDKPVIVNRAPGSVALKTPLAFKRFELADAKKDGKNLKATDKIKTASGKEITVEDYLSRVNEVEQEISKRGY